MSSKVIAEVISGSEGVYDTSLSVGLNNSTVINNDQVLILSGGGATSPKGFGSDTNFFISGSIGSRGTGVKGSSVFGGDVVHSGSVIILDPGGTDENLKLVRGSVGNNFITFEEDTGVNVGQIYANSSNLFIKGSSSGNDIIFRVGSSNVLRMDGTTERIGIGNNIVTPAAMLHVSGTDPMAFRVDSGTRPKAIMVDGEQVLILSGGSATSINDAGAPDVAFYVSGSRTSIGPGEATTGRNAGTRTNAIFGGDVVLSGSLYGASENPPGNPVLHLKSSTIELAAFTQVAICDSLGGSPGFGVDTATDVFFGVTGSIGGKDSGFRSVSVFGGDTVVSGSLYVSPTDATKGIVIVSPDGSKFRITVDNAGNLSTSPG